MRGWPLFGGDMKEKNLSGWKISLTQTVPENEPLANDPEQDQCLRIDPDTLGQDFSLEIYPDFMVIDSPWHNGTRSRVQLEPRKALRKRLQKTQPGVPFTHKLSHIFHFMPEKAKNIGAELKIFAKEGQPRTLAQKVWDTFLSLLALVIVIAGGLVVAYMTALLIHVYINK